MQKIESKKENENECQTKRFVKYDIWLNSVSLNAIN